MNLREAVDRMHAFLRGEAEAENLPEQWNIPRERMEYYRDAVRGHVAGALESNFALTRAVLPGDLWDELTADYIRRFPPRQPELNHSAEPFPDFLADRISASQEIPGPALVELSRIEWLEWVALSNREEIPPRHDLTEPVLNPTLEIHQCRYATASFIGEMRSWMHDEERAKPAWPPPETGEIAFVFRRPDTGFVRTIPARDGHLFVLKMLHEGLTVRNAAEEAGCSGPLVKQFLKAAAAEGFAILPLK
ncbi:MAG: hypothetical protein GMKNLPBB_00577 [Myxococcota bacterium]|nr:hypothetical protein [Myxococcota bacterium]